MKKILATNKAAKQKYEIMENFEAGVKLTGPEVKSCKAGQVSLRGSYATIDGRALILLGCHISRYQPAFAAQKDYHPSRTRILLLTKKQLNSLIGKLKEKRLSLVPLTVYSKNGLIKVDLGLARGRKKYEKRELIKKRDVEREIRKILK